jgi:hypothetical protein
VANGDDIAADENLLHQQSDDLLTLAYFEGLGARAQFASKRRQGLG